MTDIHRLSVMYCESEDALPSLEDYVDSPVTWQEFFGKRNEILQALRPFGTVGPIGEVRMSEDADGPARGAWHTEHSDPDFFVVDDQPNEENRYHYIEVQKPDLISRAVLTALWSIIELDPRWTIGIGIPNERYVFLAPHGIWTTGNAFRGCWSMADVIARSKDKG